MSSAKKERTRPSLHPLFVPRKQHPDGMRTKTATTLLALVALALTVALPDDGQAERFTYEENWPNKCVDWLQNRWCGPGSGCASIIVWSDSGYLQPGPPPSSNCFPNSADYHQINYAVCYVNGGCDPQFRGCRELHTSCLIKYPEYIAYHRRKAADARDQMNNFFDEAVQSLFGVSIFTPLPSYLAGKAFGALRTAQEHDKLADDPPDPNYSVFYQYPSLPPSLAWGLSPSADSYLNQLLRALTKARYALTGSLVSTERALGAWEANEVVFGEAQEAATEQFESDFQRASNEAALLLGGLAAVLQSQGVGDFQYDAATLDAKIDDLLQSGLPSDFVNQLNQVTGDPTAADWFQSTLVARRGVPRSGSFFASLSEAAGHLAVSDCDNGIDDDGDGSVDFPADSACSSAADPSERMDEDLDGIDDTLDNCPHTANSDQSDVGALGTGSSPDGTGDACQCGDVNGDGRVSLADAVMIRRSLLQPPTSTQTRPTLCDVNGSGDCTIADSLVIQRGLLNPPTAWLLPLCAAAMP